MILKDISILWTMLYTLVLFLALFESRYPGKKTLTLTLATMLPLTAVNLLLFVFLGMEGYGTLMLLTLSLPSCVIFWFLAKHRDSRFFFTFCMVDTVVLEIMYITNIIDHYTTPDTHLVMFLTRLVLYPLVTFLVFRYLRPMYRKVQTHTKKGWGIFAIIGFLFYVAITLMMTYPVPVTERAHQLPALCLLFLLMPVIYLHIINTLRNQQQRHELEQQEDILRLQVGNLTERLETFRMANDKFRMERHNSRHKLQILGDLVERKDYDALQRLLQDYTADLNETVVERYCSFPVVDAALSVYLQKARNLGVAVSTGLDFPETLAVSEAELATVLANVLENAIHACQKVQGQQPFIRLQVIQNPRFMIRLSNSCVGDILFDEDHVPVNYEEDHGFGMKTLVGFCEKYGVYYGFEAEKGVFTVQMIFG